MEANFQRTNARDPYYVYRPLLDLIGKSEGTDKGKRYNETLAYGALTGGPVNLVDMTLAEVDQLQGKMLRHPNNKWNSSAIGRYQIVRTTRRAIQSTLSIPASEKFDEAMQDRMACFLLGQRGIDKWLAGRLKAETLLDNLAREWASLPTHEGKGFYGGQRAAVTIQEVAAALAEVRKRHLAGQPTVEVEKPVVPQQVENQVKKETGLWGWLTTGLGSIGSVIAWLQDGNTAAIVAFGCIAIIGLLIVIFLGPKLASSIRKIREELS